MQRKLKTTNVLSRIKIISSKNLILFSTIFLLSNIFFGDFSFAVNQQKLSPLKEISFSISKKYKTLLNKFKKPKEKISDEKKEKRKLANQKTYSCLDTFTDKHSTGYIQLGYGCDSNKDLCIALYHIERNRCEGDSLIRYYCDPKKESLFSVKKIKCSQGCHFQGLSGSCIQ